MGQQSSQPSYPSSLQRDASASETQRLLPPDPEEEIDHDGCFPPHTINELCPANPFVDLPVYITIHRIRRDIINAIDDPYSIEQLRDPRMNISVVRPLVDKLYDLNDVSVDRDPSKFGLLELVFIIFTFGFLLDMSATILEHGWDVYTQNLWSFLDVTFATIFGIYLILRIHGWRLGDISCGQQAMDVLAMGAPVLVPRLAFNLMSENMLFISLRAMMRDFTVLTVLAVWCFAGFLLSMTWLAGDEPNQITISKWMLWVWFGLDGTGIQRSVEFHWLLGPILMIAFAFLGNTLFLTILVSMLSSTFSTIVANANAEIQFRRAVLTLEGVKSDAISRTLNAPLLLIIGIVERRTLWAAHHRVAKAPEQLPRNTRTRPWDLTRSFSVHGDIQAVFSAEPPQSVEDEITIEEADLAHPTLEDEFVREFGPSAAGLKSKKIGGKNRRDSVAPFASLTQHLKDLITEGSDAGAEDVKGRLESLEQSTMRIEHLLGKICEKLDGSLKSDMDDDDDDLEGEVALEDLDKTGLGEVTT
ncbi:hypothetical protein G7Y89_g2606 [Cudoniella acicularis]|uniref:Calcium channel YVC1-like C-terminal transmembrane domain-containing protein n=1 Tax=Cudoniella acicularis TaxID=354080 RepID=A0A8H4RW03_9HELO|nr:hypothetical protein G7Y89_g2606 [Cudoniella acicularis]